MKKNSNNDLSTNNLFLILEIIDLFKKEDDKDIWSEV